MKRVGKSVHSLKFLKSKSRSVKPRRCSVCNKAVRSENRSGLCNNHMNNRKNDY